jgi:regulator of sirC expression with transglutaminase-like and TPR domain
MTPTPLDYFAALVRQNDAIPLFEAAVSIAQDSYPRLDIEQPQSDLDRMSASLRAKLSGISQEKNRFAALNDFFYGECGFAGNVNNYYDPDNSYIHRVLTTRRGIPISLAVVYMELAREIGLVVKGISFPGHFLMRLSLVEDEIIIDPLNGTSLSVEELEHRAEAFQTKNSTQEGKEIESLLRAAHPREVLFRMLRNLKALFLQNAEWGRLIELQNRVLILFPDDPIELRDRGIAYARTGQREPALDDIRRYLAHRPGAEDTHALLREFPELQPGG